MYNEDQIAQCAVLACLFEAGAEKPGNVTPTRAFRDMAYEHFLRSAVAIGPEMGRAGARGVGETILAAVQATRPVAPGNTNLGIALLFAPLAKAGLTPYPQISGEAGGGIRHSVRDVLRALTVEDARKAYGAIRLAYPAGVREERVEKHDVHDEPQVTLLEAMAEAAGRDSVAAEYAYDYAITFEQGLPAFRLALSKGLSIWAAVVQAYLELLAAVPDTLIARKRGRPAAEDVSQGAAQALAAGGVFSEAGRAAIAAFDATLRDPQNSLNPGTTADLIAAALFVHLLEAEGEITDEHG